MLHEKTTDRIIKAFYQVYNTLGYGFLEKVYENALCIELRRMGMRCCAQEKIDVRYEGELVGEYFADIPVEDTVMVDLKAAEGIRDEHRYQLVNYLKATGKEVGLLPNFGRRPELRRVVFSNERKPAQVSGSA
jgi:GxxExxY protein